MNFHVKFTIRHADFKFRLDVQTQLMSESKIFGEILFKVYLRNRLSNLKLLQTCKPCKHTRLHHYLTYLEVSELLPLPTCIRTSGPSSSTCTGWTLHQDKFQPSLSDHQKRKTSRIRSNIAIPIILAGNVQLVP